MSFRCDTILPGSTRLYVGGAGLDKDGRQNLRSSQSRASLLTPLIRLVKDPIKVWNGAVGNAYNEADTSAPSGHEADRKQVLYLRMRNAETYEEWERTATELDVLEGNDAWKSEDESPEYDYALVATRLKEMESARISCDVEKMLFLIRTSLTRGLGGMGDLRLYKHSHIGTKALIERYIDSVQQTLVALLEVSAKEKEHCRLEPRIISEKLLFTRQSFGRSALLLSGGGTFGMNHIGVVKCLWEACLLPRIISGASAGSIVCAVLCTKTDVEIPRVLDEFCYGDLAVFEKEGEEDGLLSKATRFLKYGALFDISHLMRVMRNLLGDITFQEAYNRSRRILNITVSSASLYELPRLLNYVTAPDVMIWSAVCASCSVPFIFSAASLLAKDRRTGKEVPWNPTPNAGWIDGSVDNDLPMTRLAEMFNVNHFIVSQVNPHVVPFLAKEEEIISAEAQEASAFSAGPAWLHNLADLARGEALHRLQVLSDLGVLSNYLTKARSVINQRYSGDITIFPSISYSHFPKVLSNPTTEYMLHSMLTGERATWPKLSRVKNHLAIELAIDETIQKFRARVVFSPSQVDLRLNNLNRPLSQGNDSTSHNLSRDHISSSRPVGAGIASSTPSKSMLPRSTTRSRTKSRTEIALHTKSYLPSQSMGKHSNRRYDGGFNHDTFSSSTNPDATDSSPDEDPSLDTDTSDLLSSPSPPHSPPSALPTLWPSTRQILFPSASQPTTPSIPVSSFGNRSSSLLNLAMTMKHPGHSTTTPSSPELRYKRLFHPPAESTHPRNSPVQVDTQTIQLSPTLTRPLDIPSTIYSPPQSPPDTDNDAQKPVDTILEHISAQERYGSKEEGRAKRTSRRGSVQHTGLNLLLDISGTRGMLLRRKMSSKSPSDPK